jgi:Cu(I)/Ag(I) efflux system membrane fusion protein
VEILVKVTEKQPVESHSIEHLLRPTDSFVVGSFETTTPKDTNTSSEINLLELLLTIQIRKYSS